MAAAMRSMVEWAASESMPSEPVKMPVTSLSRVMARAATTETRAAVRFSACGLCGVGGLVAAAWLIEESYRVCRGETGEKCCGYPGIINFWMAVCSGGLGDGGPPMGTFRGYLPPPPA